MKQNNRRRGSVFVETALLLLVFITMIVAVCDCGQFLFLHQTLNERVRSAVRYGSVRAYNEAAIRNMVLYGQPTTGTKAIYGLTADKVLVSREDAGTDEDRIVVKVSGFQFTFISPFMSKTATGSTISASLPYEVM